MWFAIIIAALAAYLLGNHNGAVITSLLIANDDVRNHGSGNAGLTNFIRNFGIGKALFVFLIDGGKAAIGALICGMILKPYGYYQEGLVLGSVAVMLGHDFPVLMGFRGGKGILSGLFIGLVIDWRIGVLILIVFAIAYGLTMYVSLGSVLAATTFTISFVVLHHDNLLVMSGGVFMGLLTIWMHRSNILRLAKGQERKTNLFAKGSKQ